MNKLLAHAMLADLDRSIEVLLTGELSGLLSKDGQSLNFSFEPPVQNLIGTLPTINLFLYDVHENLELRDRTGSWQRKSDGTAIKDPALVRLDCSYLITAWPSDSDKPLAKAEHLLLGQVMEVLLRYSQLPVQVLQGKLKGQEPPPRSRVLHPSQLHSWGEFWQAMGGKPKTALHYTITISISVDDREDEVPLILKQPDLVIK